MADFSIRIALPIRRLLDEHYVDSLLNFTVAECAKHLVAPVWILFVKKNLAAVVNHLRDVSSRGHARFPEMTTTVQFEAYGSPVCWG